MCNGVLHKMLRPLKRCFPSNSFHPMNRDKTFASAANTHPNATVYNDLVDCGYSKKDPGYEPLGWESGTTEPRMQQYIRRTRDVSFQTGIGRWWTSVHVPSCRNNMKSPWVYADCCSVHWYTWSKNFLSMLRSRGMGWKRSLKLVPTDRGDLVTATKAAQNGWSPILKCCSHYSPLKPSNCQAEFTHIHLFLCQYCSPPEIVFLCPWDVPSIFLPSSEHHRWKSKCLHELSPALLLPGYLHPLQSPRCFSHSEFIPHPSGPACAFLRHWKRGYCALLNGEGHSPASPTPYILLWTSGGAEGQLCLSRRWNSGHGREIYREEWKLLFDQVPLTAGFGHHASPPALWDTAGLVQSHTAWCIHLQKGCSHIYGAALGKGVGMLLSTPTCPRSR